MESSGEKKKQHDEDESAATAIFRFDPPLYIQRYDMIIDLIKRLHVRSLMDIGCAECKLVNLIKNCSQDEFTLLVGVDICGDTLRSATDLFSRSIFDFVHARPRPLELYLVRGDIARPDDYFVRQFGSANNNCQLDMISLVEVVEHMYPDTLRECIRTVFERLAPKCVVITTPNREFNVVFENEEEKSQKFRHWDHKFEWTRAEFETWCNEEILLKYTDYSLLDGCFTGLGLPPREYPNVGWCTQAAVFIKKTTNSSTSRLYDQYLTEKKRVNMLTYMNKSGRHHQHEQQQQKHMFYLNESELSEESGYSVVFKQSYPFEPYENFETETERHEFILNEINYLIRFLSSRSRSTYRMQSWEEEEKLRQVRVRNELDEYDDHDIYRLVSVEQLLEFSSMRKLKATREDLLTMLLNDLSYRLTHDQDYIIYEVDDLDRSFSTLSIQSGGSGGGCGGSEKMLDSPMSDSSSVWSGASSSNWSIARGRATTTSMSKKSSKTTTTMTVVMTRGGTSGEENWDEEVEMDVLSVVPKLVESRDVVCGQFEDVSDDNDDEDVSPAADISNSKFIYDLILESDAASSTTGSMMSSATSTSSNRKRADIQTLSHFPGVNYQADAAVLFSQSLRPRLRKKRRELTTQQSTPPHPEQFED